MTKWKYYITKEELAKRTGISKPTIELYIKEGLIPKATEFAPGEKGKGRRGLFYAYIVSVINDIRALTEQGYTLKEIKNRISDDIAKKEMLMEYFNRILKLLRSKKGLPSESQFTSFIGFIQAIYGTVAPPQDEIERVFKELFKKMEIFLLYNYVLHTGTAY